MQHTSVTKLNGADLPGGPINSQKGKEKEGKKKERSKGTFVLILLKDIHDTVI